MSDFIKKIQQSETEREIEQSYKDKWAREEKEERKKKARFWGNYNKTVLKMERKPLYSGPYFPDNHVNN